MNNFSIKMENLYYTVGEWDLSKDIMEKYASKNIRDKYERKDFMKSYTENYEPSLVKRGKFLVLRFDYFEITINLIDKYYTICANFNAFKYACSTRKKRIDPDEITNFDDHFRSLFTNRININSHNESYVNLSNRKCINSQEENIYSKSLSVNFRKNNGIDMYLFVSNITTPFYCFTSGQSHVYPITESINVSNRKEITELENILRQRLEVPYRNLTEKIVNNLKFEIELESCNCLTYQLCLLHRFGSEKIELIKSIISENGIASRIVTASDYLNKYYTVFEYCTTKSARNRVEDN